MNAAPPLIDHLVNESRMRRQTEPWLNRLVLDAAQSALQDENPDDYCHKCHGAALSIFMTLRSLRIRSTIFGGTVSWLFGGVAATGTAWESKCGFWTPNLALPSPHAWLVTEFGELVDLTCFYFHLTSGNSLQDTREHDLIPMIRMHLDHLTALAALQYAAPMKFEKVDLDGCDDLARRVVAKSLVKFWGSRVMEALIQKTLEPDNRVPSLQSLGLNDGLLLEGPSSIDMLRNRNTWVSRNLTRTPAQTLLRQPVG